LAGTDWNEGWLDGIPFPSIVVSEQIVMFAGLLVWCDDAGGFQLEPFQSRFQVCPTFDELTSYLLCFRSQLEHRRPIKYTSSIAKASRRIAIPDANDAIDESEWRYLFSKSAL
jgi:hypothetical protein